jgi:uncharacterized protein (DUF2236 family)
VSVLPVEQGPIYVGNPEDDPLFRFGSTVRVEDVPEDVVVLAEREIDGPEYGFFGPDSAIWELTKENRLLLASLTPLLLQIAHPKVGAALDDHSTIQNEYSNRMQETYDITDTIIFGDAASAIRAAVIVRRIHERVRGETEEDVGNVDAGEPYYANDPELMLWVWATLVDQVLAGYETYIGPLTTPQRRQFYREMKLFGQLVGMPPQTFPKTVPEFRSYYQTTVDEEITVGTAGAAVADAILVQLPSPLLGAFFAAATMPDPVRDEYGLPWGPGRARLHRALSALIRNVPNWTLPARLRYREKYRKFDRV